MTTAPTLRDYISRVLKCRLLPPLLRVHIFENYSKEKLAILDSQKRQTKIKIGLKPILSAANSLIRTYEGEDVTFDEMQTGVNSVLFKTRPSIDNWGSEPSIEITRTQLNTFYSSLKESTEKLSRAEKEFMDGFDDASAEII